MIEQKNIKVDGSKLTETSKMDRAEESIRVAFPEVEGLYLMDFWGRNWTFEYHSNGRTVHYHVTSGRWYSINVEVIH